MTKTHGERRRDKADNGSKLYVHVVYRKLSFYQMTDPQTYNKAFVAMEPSREDSVSYNLFLGN
jgi:hypothetical protein